MARIVSKYTHQDKVVMIAQIGYCVKIANLLMEHLGFTPETRARFWEHCAGKERG